MRVDRWSLPEKVETSTSPPGNAFWSRSRTWSVSCMHPRLASFGVSWPGAQRALTFDTYAGCSTDMSASKEGASMLFYLYFALPPLIAGLVAQAWVRRAFADGSKVATVSGLTGA